MMKAEAACEYMYVCINSKKFISSFLKKSISKFCDQGITVIVFTLTKNAPLRACREIVCVRIKCFK